MHAPRPRGGTLADLSTPFRDRASGTKSEGVRSFGSGNRPSACLTPIFDRSGAPARNAAPAAPAARANQAPQGRRRDHMRPPARPAPASSPDTPPAPARHKPRPHAYLHPRTLRAVPSGLPALRPQDLQDLLPPQRSTRRHRRNHLRRPCKNPVQRTARRAHHGPAPPDRGGPRLRRQQHSHDPGHGSRHLQFPSHRRQRAPADICTIAPARSRSTPSASVCATAAPPCIMTDPKRRPFDSIAKHKLAYADRRDGAPRAATFPTTSPSSLSTCVSPRPTKGSSSLSPSAPSTTAATACRAWTPWKRSGTDGCGYGV